MNKSPSQPSPVEELERLKSEAVEQSKIQLQTAHAERSALRRAEFAEDARVLDRFRDLLLGQLHSKEAELKQLAADRRKLIEARTKLIASPLQMKGDGPVPTFFSRRGCER